MRSFVRSASRAGRAGAGGRLEARPLAPQSLEQRLLEVVSEQVGVRVDQLPALLGSGEREVAIVLGQLRDRGWIAREELVSREPEWVWLRSAGVKAAGTGFPFMRPKVSTLRHRFFINEVRHWLQQRSPDGVWIPERRLHAEKGRRVGGNAGHVADGVLEIDGKRHAIEVEMTRKLDRRVVAVIEEHLSRYDAVVYFCAAGQLREQLDRLALELDDRRLIVRTIPGAPRGAWSTPPELPRVEPTEAERQVLRLVSEQGAIPLDQLARFLAVEVAEAELLAQRLERRGFARLREGLGGEPLWLWLTHRGARCSGTRLAALRPSLGALVRLRALNGFRHQLEVRCPAATWISGRYLALGSLGRGGGLPRAVVEVDDQLHAIELIFRASVKTEWYAARFERWSREYDLIVCYCREGHRARIERLVRKRGWSKVVIRSWSGAAVWSKAMGPYEPTPEERSALRLLSEQRSLTLSQLATLMRIDAGRAKQIVADLEAGELLGRHSIDGWPGVEFLVCRFRGNRLAGLELPRPRVPAAATVGEVHALSAARIQLSAGCREVEWSSRRMLARDAPHLPQRSLPQATARLDGRSVAIDSFYGRNRAPGLLIETVAPWRPRYERVVCVCQPSMEAWIGKVLAEAGLGMVETLAVPAGP